MRNGGKEGGRETRRDETNIHVAWWLDESKGVEGKSKEGGGKIWKAG